jgi:hypothetical protein
MVGKLHKSWLGGHVYMLIAVDKFTKWVEAAPVTNQDSTATINFIKLIIFCFGVPHSIITDNGTNFTSKQFKNYCESMGIKLKFASIAHLKTNGQVKKANGLICNCIKKRLLAPLEKAKQACAEAVLPVKITHEAPRITAYDETTSNEALQDDVDPLNKARDVALERSMQYE